MSLVVNLFLKRFEIPPLIGYILTGALVVEFFNIKTNEVISDVAEFGIVLLMFMIGLEFSFDRLKTMRQETITFGVLQVGITSVVFTLFFYYFMGTSFIPSLVVAMGISLSSTAIVLTFYEEKKLFDTSYGRNVLGILIMQDIAVIPILIIISIITNEDSSIGVIVLKTMISALVVLALLLIPGKKIAMGVLSHSAKSKSDELFMISVLFVVFGAATLVHAFGFSMSLGAFIAGMLISKTSFKFQAESSLAYFKDVLLALFFISVGMQINFSFLKDEFFTLLLFSFVVVVVKCAVIFFILKWFRTDRSSLKTALSLAQIGEFSFAIYLIAHKNNIYDNEISRGVLGFLNERGIINYTNDGFYQFMVLMVIFSMIATPFILKSLNQLCNYILSIKIEQKELPTEIPESMSLNNHIIVVGYGEFGEEVVEVLKDNNKQYIAVDSDGVRVELGIKKNDLVLYGNVRHRAFFKKLAPESAKCVIIAIDQENIVQSLCEEILRFMPNLTIIAKVDSRNMKEALDAMNITSLNSRVEIAKLLVEKV